MRRRGPWNSEPRGWGSEEPSHSPIATRRMDGHDGTRTRIYRDAELVIQVPRYVWTRKSFHRSGSCSRSVLNSASVGGFGILSLVHKVLHHGDCARARIWCVAAWRCCHGDRPGLARPRPCPLQLGRALGGRGWARWPGFWFTAMARCGRCCVNHLPLPWFCYLFVHFFRDKFTPTLAPLSQHLSLSPPPPRDLSVWDGTTKFLHFDSIWEGLELLGRSCMKGMSAVQQSRVASLVELAMEQQKLGCLRLAQRSNFEVWKKTLPWWRTRPLILFI